MNVQQAAEKRYTVLEQNKDTYMQDLGMFKVPIIKLIFQNEIFKQYMVQKYYNRRFDDHYNLDTLHNAIENVALSTVHLNKSLNSPFSLNFSLLNILVQNKGLVND